jgi:hypothetical protein
MSAGNRQTALVELEQRRSQFLPCQTHWRRRSRECGRDGRNTDRRHGPETRFGKCGDERQDSDSNSGEPVNL